MADLVTGATPLVDPAAFRLGRFSDGTRMEILGGDQRVGGEGAAQDADPVAPADLLDQRLAVAGLAHGADERGKPGDVADLARDQRAVEVGPERDPVLAETGEQVVEVADHGREPGVGDPAAVLAQEADRVVEPDDTAALGDGVELGVGQVARGGRQRVGVGVGGDERLVRQRGDVAEAGGVEVREVEEDAEAVAGAHQLLAGGGQARALVGVAGEAEGDADAEGVRPRPHRAERAQAGGVEHLEPAEVGADRLGPLDVEDRRHSAGGLGRLDLGDGGADPEVAGVLARHPQEDAGLLEGHAPGVARVDRADVRQVDDAAVVLVADERGERGEVAGHVDGEEAAAEPAGAGARQVEVALPVAVDEMATGDVPLCARGAAARRCARRKSAASPFPPPNAHNSGQRATDIVKLGRRRGGPSGGRLAGYQRGATRTCTSARP